MAGRKFLTGVLALACVLVWSGGALALTLEEGLAQGKTAMAVENWQQAYDIYSELVREYPANETVNFNLGRAAFELENYPFALMAFERVLARNPDSGRVKLEMGRTYMAMEQYPLAKEYFQEVLAGEPPANVRRNIETLLAQIDERDERIKWNFAAGVGVFYDDNANAGVDDKNIDTILGEIVLDDESEADESWGGLVSGGVTMRYRLDDKARWSMNTGVSAYAKFYEEDDDYNLLYTRVGVGFRYMGDRVVFRAPFKFENLDYGEDDLLNIWGIEPSLTYLYTPTLHFVTRTGVEIRDHQQEEDRDSFYLTVGQSVRWLFGAGRHEFMPGVRFFTEEAEDDQYSNYGYEVSAGLTFHLPWTTDFYSRAYYRSTDYMDRQTVLASDDRRDDQVGGTLGLRKQLTEVLDGLSADLNVQYTDNDSNFDLYEYDRTVVTFSLSYYY